MAIYLGYLRAGWPGLVLGGICFIAPAMLLVLALAWGYVTYGALPQVGWLFYGIQPVVVAIVAHAIWTLSRTVLKDAWRIGLAGLVLVLYLLGTNVPVLLFGGGLLYGLLRWFITKQPGQRKLAGISVPLSVGSFRTSGWLLAGAGALAAVPFSLWLLFLTFLKIGAVIYGSGYVLLAFLRADLVQNLHWLTDRQLLDAISIGQFTPGPVFTTATFIGYVLGGWPGALLATLGIFLPYFVFVALVLPLADRLRQSSLTAPLLDGVNAAALALMVGVLIQLAQHALTDPLTIGLALAAFVVVLRFKVNSAGLILLGGILGFVRGLL